MALRRRRSVWHAARVAALLVALPFAAAAADERDDPLGWLGSQPLTLFDLGIMRLERDVLVAAPWLAESDAPSDRPLAGVQYYNVWRRQIVVYAAIERPRGERTEANCIALFRRLVERLLANTPEGTGRAAW